MVSIVKQGIYLAGKIGHNDWRHEIVAGLRGSLEIGSLSYHGETLDQIQDWPVLQHAIFGRFHYTGPFFTSCDHGCYHGAGGHGNIPVSSITYAASQGNDGVADCIETLPRSAHASQSVDIARHAIVSLCARAIAKSALLFAWIDSPDCYGTLAEIGLAAGLNKQVILAFAPGYDWSEFWFVDHLVSLANAYLSPQDTARAALERSLLTLGWFNLETSYDSPLEELFAHEWIRQTLHLVYPLSYQHGVKDGRYRLDFAYHPLNIGIELDGYTYHSDRDAFTRDRQRQREIEMHGWRIIRFSGDELREDITRCVREAEHFLSIQQHRDL